MKFIGNCNSLIDWDKVIASLDKPSYVGPSHKKGDNIPGLDEVTDLWSRANFKTVHEDPTGTVGWDMFISGKDFDERITEKFLDFIGLQEYNSCWISKIEVGKMAPYHWDVNDDEEQLSSRNDIRRFHCHIGKPKHGHVLLVDGQCFYNQEQGNTYEWPSRKSWHAGLNCGLEPKYILNLW